MKWKGTSESNQEHRSTILKTIYSASFLMFLVLGSFKNIKIFHFKKQAKVLGICKHLPGDIFLLSSVFLLLVVHYCMSVIKRTTSVTKFDLSKEIWICIFTKPKYEKFLIAWIPARKTEYTKTLFILFVVVDVSLR